MDACESRFHGVNLPGRAFCCPDGSEMGTVHVGVQVRREPDQLVRADEPEALWELDVDVVSKDGLHNFADPQCKALAAIASSISRGVT